MLGFETLNGHTIHIAILWFFAIWFLAVFGTIVYYVYVGQQQDLGERYYSSIKLQDGTIDLEDGGRVDQVTSKFTAVTLNAYSGKIVTFNTAVGNGASFAFTVNNNKVLDRDTVILSQGLSGSSSYLFTPVNVTNGSFDIMGYNTNNASLSENIDLNFALIRGSIS